MVPCDARDARSRRGNDQQDAPAGQRHGPHLPELAAIGSHYRKVRGARGESLRGIERVAGIFDAGA
jgi:hypothetical protein